MSNDTETSALAGKVALITGAGQGIGQGIAFSLAKRGVKVAAVGRTLSKCENTVAQINERFGTEAIAVECDISDLAALDGLIERVVATYVRLDI
jgi:NAD(P)-dependent dehydrogenase (short-subunit alcohol dehydrogenase family)